MSQTKVLLAITIIATAGCQTTPGGTLGAAETRASFAPVSEAVLERHVETLSDDSFLGRAPGTKGGLKTRAYLISEMQRLGLEPIGDSYEHRVELVSRSLDPSTSRAMVQMGNSFDQLSYGPEAVFWTKRDDTSVTIRGSELVFVGHGVVAPEYGWDDYAGIDVNGKTVVMLINDPGFRQRGKDFGGKAMTYYGRWTYKFEEAARQGAEAAIIVHQDEPAAYGWGVVEGSWSGEQLDLPRQPGATPPVKLEGWITIDQAEALFSAAGMNFSEMEARATRKGFKAQAMGELSLTATLFQELSVTESANVAGVLRGSERPDEYVLYTAHWDHLGVSADAAQAGQDGIFNGAVDNATGTGGILAIAESWRDAGMTPKRSHLFLAVTAEESGLLGSKAFASNPPVPLRSIVGGLNIDALLPTGPARDVTVIGYGASELEDILEDVAGAAGVTLSPDPSPQNGYFYRSDHVEFAKRGVPMLYIDNGMDLINGGRQAGQAAADAYTAGPYHGVSDEFDPAVWRFDGMAQVLTILRDVGVELSETGADPNWYEGNEFRAIRDAQLAGER